MVIAFALNTSYAVAKPALVSILPSLVPRDELTEAVGVNTLQFVTGQMIGPVLSAIVIATAGVPWAFAINALSYLGPVLSMVYLSRLVSANERPCGARAADSPAARRSARSATSARTAGSWRCCWASSPAAPRWRSSEPCRPRSPTSSTSRKAPPG